MNCFNGGDSARIHFKMWCEEQKLVKSVSEAEELVEENKILSLFSCDNVDN